MTQEELISKFIEINNLGWVGTDRNKSDGNVGNLLEDLLGIEENNLQLPDIAGWEIKAQKINCQPSSLLTLFHSEPEPRELRVVPYLLSNYGWAHKNGREQSFRQTLNTLRFSEKGFKVKIQDNQVKVIKENDITFIEPYWNFEDLKYKTELKLKNQFNVLALAKNQKYKYCDVIALEGFNFDKFIQEIELGNIWIDFDAKTTHNHGTKFRIKQNLIMRLYDKVTQII